MRRQTREQRSCPAWLSLVSKKQDRNTAFDAPDARGIMVCMRSGRTDDKRGMNPGTVRRRARSEKFFLLHMLCYGRRRGGNALRQVSRTSRGRRAPLHGGVEHAHICFVDDGTPGGCTREEKCALRSCLMSIHALAWMSIAAPFEREQVDTVFEGRSGYPDLTKKEGLVQIFYRRYLTLQSHC